MSRRSPILIGIIESMKSRIYLNLSLATVSNIDAEVSRGEPRRESQKRSLKYVRITLYRIKYSFNKTTDRKPVITMKLGFQ